VQILLKMNFTDYISQENLSLSYQCISQCKEAMPETFYTISPFVFVGVTFTFVSIFMMEKSIKLALISLLLGLIFSFWGLI